MSRPSRRWIGPGLVGVLALAACGSDDGQLGQAPPETAATTPPPDPPVTDPPAPPLSTAPGQVSGHVMICGDVEPFTTDLVGLPSAPDGFDPVFHGVVATYADEHAATFGGLWIDREAYGTVIVAFTDDPDAHRAALAERRPSPHDVSTVDPPPEITDDRPLGEWDTSFDVVQVPHPLEALAQLSGPVHDALRAAGVDVDGIGVDVRRNRVAVHPPGPLEPFQLVAFDDALAGLPLEKICVDSEVIEDLEPPIDPGTPLEVITLPGEDGYRADTMAECNGTRFPLGALERLVPIEELDDDGLRSVIEDSLTDAEGGFAPRDGWALLHADDGMATFVNLDAHPGGVEGSVWFVHAEMGRNGWIWSGSGSSDLCDVYLAIPDRLGTVRWELDPAHPEPTADSTEVHLLAEERACANGEEMGERLLGPEVVETDDAVHVAFAAIPPTGGQACPSNPSTPVTVTLDAPLGDRELRDGLLVGPITELVPEP